MKKIFICVIAISCLIQPSFGYSKKDYKRAISTNVCRNCDLSKLNLTGGRFAGADFSGSDFSYTNFTKANLRKANMTGAKITGANFYRTKLGNTIWIDGKVCSKTAVGRCADKR